MAKRPVNLTLSERILDLAKEVMEKRGFDSISAFVEQLIRDEHERRFGVLTRDEFAAILRELPHPYGSAPTSSAPAMSELEVEAVKRIKEAAERHLSKKKKAG